MMGNRLHVYSGIDGKYLGVFCKEIIKDIRHRKVKECNNYIYVLPDSFSSKDIDKYYEAVKRHKL